MYYSLSNYNDSTCPLFKSMTKLHLFGVTFQKIYEACNGNICHECNFKTTKECNGINNGTTTIHSPATIVCYKKTNGELAKILQCSKRQIAKRRREGTLPKEYQ